MNRMNRDSLVAYALSALIGASSTAQELPPVFEEAIEVRVINVEAVVSDRDGKRVEGLTRESFRLAVDGATVPIEFFSEIRDGDPSDGGGLPLDLTIQGSNGRTVPTHFLVFVDDFFAIKAQRNVVLKRLAEQIEGLGPSDQMAILAFDGRRLEILSGWTRSASQLRLAFASAAERATGGVWRRMERRSFLSRLPGRGALEDSSRFGLEEDRVPASMIENRRAELRGQIEVLVNAAASGMRGLSAPEGRKAMLLLSGGWPLEPEGLERGDPALFGFREDREDGLELLRFRAGFDPYAALADTANHLGFTLYPIDVAGLGWSGPAADADAVGAGFGSSERSEEAVLLELARRTGGRALLNDLRSRALEEAVADTRSYYWIGFTAVVRADDRRHGVEIDVLEPGLEVRARREFVDLSRFAETKMLVEGGLLLAGGDRASELSIEVGEPRPASRRQMTLPVTIGIPSRRITMVPVGGKLLANVEISLGVRDRRDTLSDVVTLPAKLAAPLFAPVYPEDTSFIYYEMKVTLRREQHDLIVTVRDVPTGNVLSTRVEVRP